METQLNRARIFKRLWSPEIDSKASIPPAYVAWRAGTIILSYSVPSPHRLFKNSSSVQETRGDAATKEEIYIGAAARHMNSFNLLKLETQLNSRAQLVRYRFFAVLWADEALLNTVRQKNIKNPPKKYFKKVFYGTVQYCTVYTPSHTTLLQRFLRRRDSPHRLTAK